MAYILGLWFADGYISKNMFGVTLNKKDEYLLKLILKKMKSNHRIYHNKNVLFFQICSNKIVNDILEKGGKYRKSLDCKFPIVPQKYLPDFIRGLWDGDGSVFPLKYRNGYSSNFISGSKGFVVDMHRILKQNIKNFNGRYRERIVKKRTQLLGKSPAKDSIYYLIELSANDTRRLRDFMYNGLSDLKMNRKHKRFIENGYICLSNSDKEFWSFKKSKEESAKVIKKENVTTSWEWHKCYKDGKFYSMIPSCPYKIYKNKGWIDWYDWLGKKRPSKKIVK